MPLLASQQRQDQQVLEIDMVHQDALIAERAADIEDIQQGVTELNEIFRDLAVAVHEQQGMLGMLSFHCFFGV